MNYVDPSGHKYTRVWDTLYSQYWYDKDDKTLFGKNGNLNKKRAVKKGDSHLIKYKKYINKENTYTFKASENLLASGVKAMIQVGLFNIGDSVPSTWSKMKKFFFGSALEKVTKIYKKTGWENFKSGCNYMIKANQQYKNVKKEYSKIKSKKIK